MSKLDDEDLWKNVEELKNILKDIFGDVGIETISKDDMIKKMQEYIDRPVLKIECNRQGSNITVKQCYTSELIDYILPELLSQLLNLVPENTRYNIIIKALSGCNSKEGKLYENKK